VILPFLFSDRTRSCC